MNRSLGLEASRAGRVGSQRTPPPRVRTPRMNKHGSKAISSFALSEDEVIYEPFAWVRSLESGKGRFVENTSPSSENAMNEQVWFTSEILPRL